MHYLKGQNLLSGRSDNLVLTQYPVDSDTRSEIEQVIGAHRYLVVSTFEHSGYINMLGSLSKIRSGSLYVNATDPSVSVFLPMLSIISFIIRANSRFTITPDFKLRRLGYANLCADGLRLGEGFIVSVFYALKYVISALRLHHAAHRVCHPVTTLPEHMIYLRAALWPGVRAGGAIAHSVGVLNAWANQNFKTTFFSPTYLSGISDEIEYREIKPITPFIIPRELNYICYSDRFRKQVVSEMDTSENAFLYQRYSIANISGVQISRASKLPLIIEYNGSEVWMARNWGQSLAFERIVSLAEKVVLKHAHLIVTVSEMLADELREMGVEPERIAVCPNGVDPEQFDLGDDTPQVAAKVRARLGIPNDAIVYTFVGTFGPWHGMNVLAEAISKISEESWQKGLYFLIVGDGVKRPEFQDSVRDKGYADRLIFPGLVLPDEIPEILAASDVTVLPTIHNPDSTEFFGSPTKLFEYMAAGCPVIASDIGQISKVLEGGLKTLEGPDRVAEEPCCGILVPEGDPSALKDAIEWALDNTKWRESAGNHARARVSLKHTWNIHVAEISEKFKEILEQERRAKKIVLINALHSKSGGGVTYLKNMLPRLAFDQRLDIHLCIHSSQQSLYADCMKGMTVHIVDFPLGFWRLLLREQLSIPALEKLVKADVVFSPANYGPLLSKKSVLLLRNALSVALVERRMGKIFYWALLYLATIGSMLRAKKVISVSNYAGQVSEGLLKKMLAEVHILPHGISNEFLSAPDIMRSDNELLVVSDLYVQKNIHTLLRALPALVDANPDVRIKIAGAPVDKDYARRLEQQLDDYEISYSVEFLGSVSADRLLELYSTCTIFVFPSTVETFGNPLVEAMACGAPVACSNTAAMPEVAGDAVAYFDPNDVNDMSRTIMSLLENPQERERLSKVARKRAQLYSWDQTAKATANILIDAGRS